jgi:putative acetyltransferase
MFIRSELADDIDGIAAVVAEAFRRAGSGQTPPEVGLVAALRAGGDWIPGQSLVAIEEGVVVGHCLCTRASVEEDPVLALGPLAVMPDRQGKGIGSALMDEAMGIAADTGEPLIGLLGDPGYYRRFGFVPADDVGIEAPDPGWGHHFQVLTLPAYRGEAGRFAYPEPFAQVS